MDVRLDDSLNDFRDEVRTWLEEHLSGEFGAYRGKGLSECEVTYAEGGWALLRATRVAPAEATAAVGGEAVGGDEAVVETVPPLKEEWDPPPGFVDTSDYDEDADEDGVEDEDEQGGTEGVTPAPPAGFVWGAEEMY